MGTIFLCLCVYKCSGVAIHDIVGALVAQTSTFRDSAAARYLRAYRIAERWVRDGSVADARLRLLL